MAVAHEYLKFSYLRLSILLMMTTSNQKFLPVLGLDFIGGVWQPRAQKTGEGFDRSLVNGDIDRRVSKSKSCWVSELHDVRDPIEKSDLILIMNHDAQTIPFAAAEFYRKGYAPKLCAGWLSFQPY